MAFSNHISKYSASHYGFLVFRGANGDLSCILERTGQKVSVTGIDDNELPDLDMVTCAAPIQTNHGNAHA